MDIAVALSMDGMQPESREKNLLEWKKYFEGLLNVGDTAALMTLPIDPATQDLPISTGDFTLLEVSMNTSPKKMGNHLVGIRRSPRN